ncbi:MAG: hypothetical protein SFZ23_06725 [Planctomycetota bacterium]|nr:hypothetical protein [Planctomycetota bacterium]
MSIQTTQRNWAARCGLAGRIGIAGLSGVALLVGLAGCLSPGGTGTSDDIHTYISTPQNPTTVSLKDWRTGQVIWSYDVPVGRQLVVRFYEGDDPSKPYPDTLRWAEVKAGSNSSPLGNSMAVPDKESRVMELSFRTSPEFTSGETGQAAGTN